MYDDVASRSTWSLKVDAPRAIVARTSGRKQGPITRLISPSDLGERLKPFVFLDLAEIDESMKLPPRLGLHAHSGIGTLTWLMDGHVDYEDDLGRKGRIEPGWMEWMQAGNGAWHGGQFGPHLRGFQLWLALPPSDELGPPYSRYVGPGELMTEGPVTVLLGRYGAATSAISPPISVNYFAVKLQAGERWRYQPPHDHDVAFVAVSKGALRASEIVAAGELVAFEDGDEPIDFLALQDVEFMIGSAAKHRHELVLGNGSVHTSPQSLARGEARIEELGRQLDQEGRAR